MRHILYLSFLFLLIVPCAEVQAQTATIVSWNVENLFDCKHDSLKKDYEFLPDGKRHWTYGRYWQKLRQVSRVIASIHPERGWPMLVGLVEVENDTVMHDLTRRSPLRHARYDYVMTHSPDVRGIDVALMYQPHQFKLLSATSHRVPVEEHGMRPTRDILHVEGIIATGDTLHALVVHLPSRANGTLNSAKYRMLAAQTLHQVVDSLRNKMLVVMGDFNAEANDPVFKQLDQQLIHLTPRHKSQRGTYVFQRRWGFLDHILISSTFAPHTAQCVDVFQLPFMLNKQGYPLRAIQGGVSDHLPLTLDIYLEE